jgi:hypothetical protein
MEFGSQKAVSLILALLPAIAASADLEYKVRHDHLFRDKPGVLYIDSAGLGYREAHKEDKGHQGYWKFEDIEQLTLAPGKITVVTYQDRKWRLGIDREFEFILDSGQDISSAYDLLKIKLDRRFTAVLADEKAEVLWEIPVKLTRVISGSEGVLKVGAAHIVFQSERPGHSRTWRYEDIDNLSSTDAYELTVTTYERAKLDYGSRKTFHFQLKQPLGEERYSILWRRLQRQKGLAIP